MFQYLVDDGKGEAVALLGITGWGLEDVWGEVEGRWMSTAEERRVSFRSSCWRMLLALRGDAARKAARKGGLRYARVLIYFEEEDRVRAVKV